MRRKSTEFTDWQLAKFEGSPDEQRILQGKVKTKDTVTLVCPQHGPYKTMLKAALRSEGHSGCYKCRMLTRSINQRKANPFSKELVRQMSTETRSLYEKTGTIPMREKCSWICPEHGVYYQTPNDRIHGHGCPVCGRNQKIKSVRHANDVSYLEDFTEESRAKFLAGDLKMQDYAEFVCPVHGIYRQQIYNHQAGHGCPVCTQGNYRSNREKDMQDFVERLGFRVEHNVKMLGEGRRREIDLYIPDLKVGFELNGQWYHSLLNVKDRQYHKAKTQQALEQGIKLYHLWEDTPAGLCKSIIAAKLGKSPTVIPARKCDIVQERTPSFFSKCHVDGDAQAKWQWSLFYGLERVAAISIRITQGEPEIARFACKRGCTVIGGYRKLLKHVEIFLREQGYTSILTYCNRDLSPDPENNIYTQMGFSFVGECPLIYWYWATKPLTINGRTYKGRIPRQVFQKHKILKDLNMEETKLTEMQLVDKYYGAVPVFNSGNFKYRKRL